MNTGSNATWLERYRQRRAQLSDLDDRWLNRPEAVNEELLSVILSTGWPRNPERFPYYPCCRGTHFDNLRFATVTSLTTNHVEAAWTPEELTVAPFNCLIHGVNDFNTLSSILRDGELRPNVLKRADQYPGVYTTLVSQQHQRPLEQLTPPDARYILVFSLNLLRRRDWHANIFESFGSFTKHTFDWVTLRQYLGEGYQRGDFEELVLHHAVSMTACQALIIPDNTTRIERQMIAVFAPHLAIYTRTEYQQGLRQVKCLRGIYLPMSDPDWLPNFSYCDAGRTGQWPSVATLRGTLLNTGVALAEIEAALVHYTHHQLLDETLALTAEARRQGHHYPVVLHPPY
jgi:hypothetical protein